MASVHRDELTETLRNEVELIERHITVLDMVLRKQPIGVIRLSRETGLKEHRVRYSLRMLEREGLVKPTMEGAVCTKDARRIFLQLKRTLAELGNRLIVAAHQVEEERKKVR
ncbi:MAG TPA: transcriptional regulator [Thermoplasmata archaeon]|nr:transcriptional regulator [Thermoplasmata archaeon]